MRVVLKREDRVYKMKVHGRKERIPKGKEPYKIPPTIHAHYSTQLLYCGLHIFTAGSE